MFNFIKIYLLLIKCLAISIMLVNTSVSYSDQIKIEKIKIDGERRLSESFILNYLPNYPNTKFSEEVLNQFTKNLYSTGLFSKINININNSTLEINVEEYSVINEISFEGNDLLDDEALSGIVAINPRDVFNENNLNESIEKIKIEYQKIGRYLADVNIKKTEIKDGRVNLIFDIKEGSLLVVKNINFIGNKSFSDNELKSYISTKEDAWYKIFGSNKFIPERLEYDKEKLKNFYNQRGFVDFNVKVARGDLLPDFSGFNLNFLISEGQRYSIKSIDILSSLIDNKKKQFLLNGIYLKKGEFFNSRNLEESSKFLINYLENDGFNFIQVTPSINKNKNFVNVNFNITEGNKKYVNKIIILGNTRTNDSVIRRELSLLEGNPFNKAKLNSSINSIKRLGYFESVNYKLLKSDLSNSLDIIIEVKEMNTGAVSFGIGYSSLNNTSMTFGLKEKNFLGEGKRLNLEASLSSKKNLYNLGMTEPYFLDRHLSLFGNIFNQESENSKGDVKSNISGVDFGVGFKSKNISQSFKYKFFASETTTSTTSTAASITGEEGVEIITSSITYSLSHDTRDSYFNPTKGYKWRFDNTLAGFGGDSNFYKSVFNLKSFYPIDYGDYIIGFKTGVGFVSAFEDEITRSNRFFMGGKSLRGFDHSGVGPRDTGNNQATGGNNFYNLSLELKSDKFMPNDTGLKWFVFSDLGSIWGTDYKSGVQGHDDKAPRITNGFGLSMVTPVGPLEMVWGFPVQSKNYDIEENFQFSIGTSF